MSTLNETLLAQAVSKGICDLGRREIENRDRDALVRYYVETIDWSLERGFPDLKTLREEFADVEDKGVFVDREFDGELFARRQAYVFHHCKGCINVAMDYESANIPMLYFANGSWVEVRCEQKENAGHPIIVPVYVYGRDTTVKLVRSKYVRYRLYYSGVSGQ